MLKILARTAQLIVRSHIGSRVMDLARGYLFKS